MRKVLLALGSMLCLSSALLAATAMSVSQYGITWTFDRACEVGQFCNGDWWVVGPVTITRIDPATATVNGNQEMNGTVINPPWVKNAPDFSATPDDWSAIQGWDSRMRDTRYRASMNIAKSLPYTVPNGSSVTSAKSYAEWLQGNAQQLETIGILTVLAAAPPEGSFRPPYIGGVDKTVRWNKSQLDYSRLRKLAIVPFTPAFASMETTFERTHIALCPSWTSDYISPWTHDGPGYGRDISHKTAAAALLLNLNYTDAQKERLLIRIVQRGIDIYGIMACGGGWWANGGHNHGRKMPMIMAGWVLNDADILSKSNSGFQEDQQHFYISQADVNLARCIQDSKRPQDAYTAAMIGIPEWSSGYSGLPCAAGSNWGVFYRYVGASTIGNILATRLMGAMDAWNHPATFDYYDRYWALENNSASYDPNEIQPFVKKMWQAYRAQTGCVWVLDRPGDTLSTGHRVCTGIVPQNTVVTVGMVGVSPNPMRNQAVFALWQESGKGNSTIEILDRDGALIKAGVPSIGNNVYAWDRRDSRGEYVKPGMYVFTITMDGKRAIGRIVVLPN